MKLEPSVDHVRVLRRLLASADGGGNLVNDAHIAALAATHRATVVTYDTDFDRFEVGWERPTAT